MPPRTTRAASTGSASVIRPRTNPAGHELRLWGFMDFGDVADMARRLWPRIEALHPAATKVGKRVFWLM